MMKKNIVKMHQHMKEAAEMLVKNHNDMELRKEVQGMCVQLGGVELTFHCLNK